MKESLIAITVLALAGYCSTWNGVEADGPRIAGHSASGVGHSVGKAGMTLEHSGKQIDGRTPAQSANDAVQQPY